MSEHKHQSFKSRDACEECMAVMRRGRAQAATPSDEKLREAARDLYSIAVAEHGHDETHSADWPACLPVHIAMNRYRAALAETRSDPDGAE